MVATLAVFGILGLIGIINAVLIIPISMLDRATEE